MTDRDDQRAREARDALEGVSRDAETVGTSSLSRMAGHFAAADADRDDPVEIWGRRIGRALSAIGVVVLSFWLGVQLGWW